MVSRIDIGPDGGPYVEIDEDAGDLVIRVPNDTVDFDSNDLLNAVLQNATMDGGSLDGVSLASALDADTQEIQNANLQNATLSDALDANNQDLNSVGTASVTALKAGSASINGALDSESLVIGGTLYDEIDNSPVSISDDNGDPVSVNIVDTYYDVIIIPSFLNASDNIPNAIRSDGISTNDYNVIDNADNKTTGLTSWELASGNKGFASAQIKNTGGFAAAHSINVSQLGDDINQIVYGYNTAASGSIDSVEFLRDDDASWRFDGRIYGRSMEA